MVTVKRDSGGGSIVIYGSSEVRDGGGGSGVNADVIE